MPRGKRCCPGGTPCHVLNRGNNRQTLFHTPGDYEAFIGAVKETLLIVSMRILAYCLMPNHWHFVLWPEADRELSQFMHQLTTTHVRRWHKAHHSEGTGHVYQGPFKSFPVADDDHLFTVCRYVERNPVRAGFGGARGRLGMGQCVGSPAPRRPPRAAALPMAGTASRGLADSSQSTADRSGVGSVAPVY